MKIIGVIALLGTLGLGIAYYFLIAPLTDNIAQGATLYAENCAGCHGAKLEGQVDWQAGNDDGTLRAPPHNDQGHTWHHGDKLLFDYTKFGGRLAMGSRGFQDFNSGMPGFGDTLSDDEINATLAFIKSTWTERNQSAQAEKSKFER